jgi:Uma2 family endonuclease
MPARRATYQDIIDTPPLVTAQIADGVLYTHPRPIALHQLFAFQFGTLLGRRFDLGHDGPGGWIMLMKPEVHLDPDVLVPDVAGWRRERVPKLPDEHFRIAPDWVGEVLSPDRAAFVRDIKLPIYLCEQVRHVWLVDPDERTLAAYVHGGRRWELLARHHESEVVRVPPFEAVALELPLLFMD